MTDEPIFLLDHYEIVNVDFIGQEKIYYCSEPIYFKDVNSDRAKHFINKLHKNEKIEIPIKYIYIDNIKFHYVQNDKGLFEKFYDGESDKISFRLFYTKKPLSVSGYKSYVDKMKTYGYFAIGYKEEDKLFFNICENNKIIDSEMSSKSKIGKKNDF